MKTYYMLTKPGIILGNAIATAGGFVLASRGEINTLLFLITLAGLCFVIASAGVFNNYIDRAMDAKMERTKNRPLVKGTISAKKALTFASVLGIIGISILSFFTNPLTVFVTIGGFFAYLVLYAFLKYRSFYGTIVGSLAGAVPPVVGYCAAGGSLDMAAFLLFMIMVLWQMPHFFSIAIYRLDDYAAASIPVLPIEKGMLTTKMHMLFYIIAFIGTALMLTFTGYTGQFYALSSGTLGIVWLLLCLSGFLIEPERDKIWARQMFVCSLIVMMGLFVAIPFDVISVS